MSEENNKTPELSSPAVPEGEDALADQVSATIAVASDHAATEPPAADVAGEAVLEEERVKDEIEIQIDLLQDPDWAVRREAVTTLGEMGDDRCVEPVVRALRDGDWQVREAAGMIGSPCVEPVVRLLRDWDIRKAAIVALGKIKDERVLEPLIGQLRNDEFNELATEALAEIGQPAVEKLVAALK